MAAKAKARTKAKPKARSKARSGGKAVRAGAGGRPDSHRTAKGNGQPRDLLSRLAGGAVVCAEGYVFELERRGYLQAGAFVPEVLFDHPEVVEQLHMDFVHAGSDVTQALTYYVHREKLRVIGREKDLVRSEEHTSELQSQSNLVCRLLLEKKKTIADSYQPPRADPQ